jgi:hypothetical protein
MGGFLAVPLILALAGCVMALVVWASRRQGGALGKGPGILLPFTLARCCCACSLPSGGSWL